MLDRGENAGMCLVESENLTGMYPEKICDTWTVLDVKNHIERQGYHFFPELKEFEIRRILYQMQKRYSAEFGYNWDSMDVAIHELLVFSE